MPRVHPQIVVSTQIVPDRSLLVLLTRTVGALEVSDNLSPQQLLNIIAVNDAVVIIEGPRSTDTLLSLGAGLYGGVTFRFRSNEEYHLRVHSASLGTVHATTRVKERVRFERVNADLYYNGFGDTLAQISYNFVDKSEKNYYMLNVQEVEREDVVENVINPRAFTSLLDDDPFNGQSYGEMFRVFPRDFKPGDSIAVSLSNISQEYYEFMRLRVDNRFSFVELVSEPVNYPSNVVGGRGFFNLYNPDVRFFVLE